MTKPVNIREIVMEVLLEINKESRYSHLALRSALDKYLYLPKQDRAFINRVCEGTIEYRILIDYVIDSISTVKVEKMKPVVREILRSAVYQLLYMDTVPDSAVCNEAVKLATKRGFYNLKGFINGVLRNIARNKKEIALPSKDNPVKHLSIRFSMPQWIVERWVAQYGYACTRYMLEDFLKEKPITIRIRRHMNSVADTIAQLRAQGVVVQKAPYVEEAYYIQGYNYLPALDAFKQGKIQVQDVSSMLVAEVANPVRGDYIIDMCAAPGGKSLHVADKMKGFGTVEARDVSAHKIELIEQNIMRTEVINVQAVLKDATVYDSDAIEKADIVLVDAPCSGLGVMGKKTDIKYRMTPEQQEELVELQRKILTQAAAYVRRGGTLVYSTCTVNLDENQENVKWFTEHFPFEPESIDDYICEELRDDCTKRGYLQLLPGVHKCDGFFLAKLKKVK